MFLEAQFGPALNPISKPKLAENVVKGYNGMDGNGVKREPDGDSMLDDDDMVELEAAELDRLHRMGIPVPGIEIKVDKYVAKVWLENLEVECSSAVFSQRVKAVVDRAVETVAPLWGQQQRSKH